MSLEAFPAQGGVVYDTDQVGTVKAYAGSTVPENWMLCDGRSIPAAAYPELALVIPPASGQITLPDLRDKFVLGGGSTRAMLSAGGEEQHVLTVEEMPSHYHNIWGYDCFTPNSPAVVAPVRTADAGATQISGRVSDAGYSQAHNNMPPYVVLAYIVKVTGVQIDPGGALVGPAGPPGADGPPGPQGPAGPGVTPAPLPWTAMTLTGNWSVVGAGWWWPEFAQDPTNKLVHLRGMVNWLQGVTPLNQPVCWVPAPFAASFVTAAMSLYGTNYAVVCTVQTDGLVVLSSAPAGTGAGAWLSLDGIYYQGA